MLCRHFISLYYQDEKIGKIIYAIDKQNEEEIEILMKESFNVNELYYDFSNIESSSYTTCLKMACFRQNFPLVKEFVSRGADVNLYDKEYLSPFSTIFEMGKSGEPPKVEEIIEISNFLLENGVTKNELIGKQNPLLVVARNLTAYKVCYTPTETKYLINYLIDKGFDYKNAELISATVSSDYLEILQFCIEDLKLTINYETDEKYLLISAIKLERYDIAKYLISIGFDKTIKSDMYAGGMRDEKNFGKTALDLAIEKGNEQLITLLKE